MQSNITKTMRMNCWSHFKKEIEVLEPTLIWFHDAVAKSSFLEAVRKEGLFPTKLSGRFSPDRSRVCLRFSTTRRTGISAVSGNSPPI
jgi:hypothetical protein